LSAEHTPNLRRLNCNVLEIYLPVPRKHSPLPVMKSARNFAIVLVTAPNLKLARALARAALDARLVACANLMPGLESHYWWQGKLERSNEVLILFKTTKSKLGALERRILARHPYDTPEFIALPLDSGTARYLDWITST
jgi:periplasmic divalent cation tolerance protein